MAAPYPNADQLKLFLQGGKSYKDRSDAVKIYNSLRIHVNKEKPGILLTERRPSEDSASQTYRETVYQPVTSTAPLRVISALGKIRRSNDWTIEYPNNDNTSILDTETLEAYCTTNFPIYGTLEQWMFTEYLHTMCVDPNAYIVILPLNFDRKDTSVYYRPVPMIVNCDRVVYAPEKGDFFIFKSTDKVDYQNDGGLWQVNQGNVYYVINADFIVRYEQTNAAGDYKAIPYNNPTGQIPVFKIRAVFKEQRDSYTLQVSRLDPMVPELNEALREYSDLQIVKVKTAYPKEWEYAEEECPTCKGLGSVPNQASVTGVPLQPVICGVCHGTGHVESPFNTIKVRPPSIGDTTAPVTPPGGIIQRDVESMKALQESFDTHMVKALEAVHMQSLANPALATSGEAKRMDNEPTQNFVYNVAEDIIWAFEKVMYFITEWRYFVRQPDSAKRRAMIPNIPVPEDFDMLPVDYVLGQIATAKTGKVNSTLIAALESSAAAKMFYNKPKLAKVINTIFDLNPLPGYTEDEKSVKLINKEVTLQDCVISSYIEIFVKAAIEKDKNFLAKSLEDQMKVMVDMAKVKMKENSAAEEVKAGLNNDPENVPGGELKSVPANPVAA